jgi:hypothetical protein
MTRALARVGWLSCAGLLVASIAMAQGPGGYVGGVGVMPYYGGFGNGGWGFNDWGAGSTPAGSYLTGMANAIRAEGEYNLNTSAAAINLEEAQKRDIENRKLWTNTYFEMRRINESYTHPKRPPRPAETWARLAQNAAPDRLPNHVLDPVNGQIIWPSALQGDEFAPERGVLEQMFAHRAMSHGAIGIQGHATVRKAVDAALAKLKAQIRQIDTRNYLEARNFLNSLGYEANFASAG